MWTYTCTAFTQEMEGLLQRFSLSAWTSKYGRDVSLHGLDIKQLQLPIKLYWRLSKVVQWGSLDTMHVDVPKRIANDKLSVSRYFVTNMFHQSEQYCFYTNTFQGVFTHEKHAHYTQRYPHYNNCPVLPLSLKTDRVWLLGAVWPSDVVGQHIVQTRPF